MQIGGRKAHLVAFAGGLVLFAVCGPTDYVDPLPPNTFAFRVFGNGPYHPWEQGRYSRVLRDVNDADLVWLPHVEVDTLRGRVVEAEPRLMRGWL